MLTGVCRLDPSSHVLRLSEHLSCRSGRICAVLHHAPLPFCRLELDMWCAADTAWPAAPVPHRSLEECRGWGWQLGDSCELLHLREVRECLGHHIAGRGLEQGPARCCPS